MSAFVPQRRRRTAAAVRVALTSAALASAVLAPATAAFAMDPAAPSPVPSAPATKPAEPKLPAPTKPADPTVPTAPTAPTSSAPTGGAQPSAQPSAPAKGGKETGAEKKDGGSGNGAEASRLVGEYDLRQGGIIRVYKLGPNHYEGRIANRRASGVLAARVEADGKDASITYNNQFITLHAADGSVEILSNKANPGQGPVTKAGEEAARCRVTTEVVVGRYVTAILMNDQEGPKAGFMDRDGEQFGGWLDRKHPQQQNGHFKIIDASTSHPKLWVKLQGGDYPVSTYDFPALPAGCDTGTAGTATGTKANGGSTGTVSAAGAQTKVTPQGGVAAGAEVAGRGDDTVLLAGGGALAAAGAAGLGFAVLYRRRAAVGAHS
ncbi:MULTISPECIES: hypothetical protein [Streptomyces]|uniref:LPXTG cell wall anchor domain-containing protein n=1 Tax=Streptomyces luteosporeus TaxID=173856 RepID=A0ABN3TKC9_9ACTN